MKVKLKTWDRMEEEFGLTEEGHIDCFLIFPKSLDEVIPEDRIIDIYVDDTENDNKEYRWDEGNFTSWQISSDMIDFFYENIRNVFVEFEDGDCPMFLRTNIPTEKLEEVYFMYEDEDLNVLMKLEKYAEENNLFVQELEFEKVRI